jgi:hypothetical protein
VTRKTQSFTPEYLDNEVTLYRHANGTYTASEYDTALDGWFASREAALAALRADVDKLAALAEAACVTQQAITLEQVQEIAA